ncbi:DUF2071 domain-containing protein [Sphingobacterium sp. SRCM116780]|uniref:DUF2071 domain-containing protein n=1 Tax=Sphingobacterium sp. SRCM116780 TaxID=2907623 RepID=UPI001F31AFCE|nr:DUF2071 domain-containing protein [Sphingobacterium sp. SRCM116780]UIR54879.1 DUF2071 domain-containing protein [Sphingobacterium sp. SRCM116780]
MKIPNIHGFIERRMLINYTVDPMYIERILPLPFRPKLYQGKAIVGICLIRLKNIKPKGFPSFPGVNSENAAHRITVEWDENGETKEGVYIPRRDTSLKLNALVGGKLFPGKHHLAKFNVAEKDGCYHLDFKSSDNTSILVDAKITDKLNKNSIFENLDNVSSFFKKGAIGYSPNGRDFDGLKLETYQWQIKPLHVEQIKSSFFENRDLFPEGTIQFDNAILMENIEHEWKSLESIAYCPK